MGFSQKCRKWQNMAKLMKIIYIFGWNHGSPSGLGAKPPMSPKSDKTTTVSKKVKKTTTGSKNVRNVKNVKNHYMRKEF